MAKRFGRILQSCAASVLGPVEEVTFVTQRSHGRPCAVLRTNGVEVAFPVSHGAVGEDGSLVRVIAAPQPVLREVLKIEAPMMGPLT